jgi:hypothetical protein
VPSAIGSDRSRQKYRIGSAGRLGYVEGVGQSEELSGREAEICAVSGNANIGTMKNASIELLIMIWKAIQEEKLERERIRQEDKREFKERMEH